MCYLQSSGCNSEYTNLPEWPIFPPKKGHATQSSQCTSDWQVFVTHLLRVKSVTWRNGKVLAINFAFQQSTSFCMKDIKTAYLFPAVSILCML
jgi:hypothetical protein